MGPRVVRVHLNFFIQKILVQGQNLAEAVIQKQSPAVPCPHCAGDAAKPPPLLWQSVFRAYPSLPPAESYQEVPLSPPLPLTWYSQID